MGKTKIHLTQDGYNEFLDHIEDLRQELQSNSRNKSDAYKSAPGDGWHDNFDFEQTKRQESIILKDIASKRRLIEDIKIIKPKKINQKYVNINDMVKLKIHYSETDFDESIYKLVGGYFPKETKEYQEISLNSPIGRAIYDVKIGETIEYNTENRKKTKVEIIEKINN